MYSIKDKVEPYYNIMANKIPFNQLNHELKSISLKTKIIRESGWDDFALYQYIIEKSLFKIKKSVTVCLNDDGSIEYIMLTTLNYQDIEEVVLYLESSPKFNLLKENIKQKLYTTPKDGLYITLMQSPFGDGRYAVRISGGIVKN